MLKFLQIIVVFTIASNSLAQKDCFLNSSTRTGPTGALQLSVSHPIKDFQTGSHILLNSNTSRSTRYNCFNISFLYINPKSDYDVVASIKNIENYSDQSGFDFSIRFAKRQSIIQGVLIISQTSNWSTIQIHYILSARNDFRVGTFIADTVQLLPCGSESGNTTVYYNLMKPWNASTKNIFVIPFLSGIKTFDPQLNVIFDVATFNASQNKLTIPFRTDQASNPIEFLYLSYIIVTMNSDFQITNMQDLSYIPSEVNVFIGMTAVQTAPQSTGTPGVLKSGIQVLNKDKFQKFFNVQGIVIQTQQNLDLLFSNGIQGSTNIIQCISNAKCSGYDGYMVYTQNQNTVFHSQCVLCQKFSSYNQTTQQCQCRSSYTRVNGSCVPKSNLCNGPNQVYNTLTNICQCKINFKRQNSMCVSICSPGYFPFNSKCYKLTIINGATTNTNTKQSTTNSISNTSSKSVVKQCIGDQIWNQTLQICECPLPNTYFDNSTKKCIQCGLNEMLDHGTRRCICVSGSFRVSGACTYCSVSGYYDGSKCQCLKGFIGNGIICRTDPNFVMQGLGLTAQTDSQSSNQTLINSPPPPLPPSSSNDLPQNFNPIILGTITLD